MSNCTATPTGNYDPGCLLVRVLFLLEFFSLPLFALAKASHPTKISIKKRQTALEGTICPRGADKFFFGGRSGEISPGRRAVLEEMHSLVVRQQD